MPGLLPASARPTGAPAAGAEVTVDFDFDVPARFDTDPMAAISRTRLRHRWQPIIALRT